MYEEKFAILHKLQNENTELYAKLSFLKGYDAKSKELSNQNSFSDEEKNQIEQENEEEHKIIKKLKSELNSLYEKQTVLQKEIDLKISEEKKLNEAKDKECEKTYAFYSEILEKCSKMKDFDFPELKSKIEILEKKRQKLFSMIDEEKKLNRMIDIHKLQQNIENKDSNKSKNQYFLNEAVPQLSLYSGPVKIPVITAKRRVRMHSFQRPPAKPDSGVLQSPLRSRL